MNADVNKKV